VGSTDQTSFLPFHVKDESEGPPAPGDGGGADGGGADGGGADDGGADDCGAVSLPPLLHAASRVKHNMSASSSEILLFIFHFSFKIIIPILAALFSIA